MDIHFFPHVRGDFEELGRLKRCGHGLSRIDLPIDDHAIERGTNFCITEICLGRLQGCLRLRNGRDRRFQLGLERKPSKFVFVHLGLCNKTGVFGFQGDRSFFVIFGLLQQCLHPIHVGNAVLQRGFVTRDVGEIKLRVDFGQQIPFGHFLVEFGVQFDHRARDECPDSNGQLGFHGSGRVDHRLNVSLRDLVSSPNHLIPFGQVILHRSDRSVSQSG